MKTHFIILISCMSLLLGQTTTASTDTDNHYPYPVPYGYQLVLDETFEDGSFNPSVWTPQTYGNGVGNAELQYYQADNINVADDILNITAKPDALFDSNNIIPHNFSSGRLSTIGKMAFRYGKIAIRAKVPDIPGTQFAFWLGAFDLNMEGFPKAGNMDIVQTGIYGQFEEVESHFQYGEPDTALQNVSRFYYSDDNFNATDGFHIYEIEWTPKKVIFMVDGHVTGRVFRNKDNAAAFDTYYYLVVNLGLQGPLSSHGNFQTYDYSNLPQSAQVDWIKVWQRPNQGGIKQQYSSSGPITNIEGGNYVLNADNTPAAYRYAFTEGQFLAFFSPNISLAAPVELADPTYPALPLKQGLQSEAFEGGSFMDWTLTNTGSGFTGVGWYNEYPLNLTAFNDASLVFYMRTEHIFSTFSVGMIDNQGTQVLLPVSNFANIENNNEWHRVEIPVSAFAQGVDLANLVYPFFIITEEPPAGETINYGLDNIHFDWLTDNTLIYSNLVDNTLLFNFEFDAPQDSLWVRLKVNGEIRPPSKIKNAQLSLNENGSASYLWVSDFQFPSETSVEAKVLGIKGGKFTWFLGDKETFSEPFIVE